MGITEVQFQQLIDILVDRANELREEGYESGWPYEEGSRIPQDGNFLGFTDLATNRRLTEGYPDGYEKSDKYTTAQMVFQDQFGAVNAQLSIATRGFTGKDPYFYLEGRTYFLRESSKNELRRMGYGYQDFHHYDPFEDYSNEEYMKGLATYFALDFTIKSKDSDGNDYTVKVGENNQGTYLGQISGGDTITINGARFGFDQKLLHEEGRYVLRFEGYEVKEGHYDYPLFMREARSEKKGEVEKIVLYDGLKEMPIEERDTAYLAKRDFDGIELEKVDQKWEFKAAICENDSVCAEQGHSKGNGIKLARLLNQTDEHIEMLVKSVEGYTAIQYLANGLKTFLE